MKKAYLILLCLLVALLAAGCQIHIDTDPWPASPGYVEPEATATPVPVTEQTQTPDQPLSTDALTPEQDGFIPVVTPTPQPNNGVVEPGFNG